MGVCLENEQTGRQLDTPIFYDSKRTKSYLSSTFKYQKCIQRYSYPTGETWAKE
jgi:hypothetical protein